MIYLAAFNLQDTNVLLLNISGSYTGLEWQYVKEGSYNDPGFKHKVYLYNIHEDEVQFIPEYLRDRQQPLPLPPP